MTRQEISDPALPGLEKALRREIAPLLSAALGAASGGAWSLLRAAPVRLRYRPGKRAIVQYALTLSGPRGEFVTPAALWFFAGGKAAKIAGKIAAPEAAVAMPLAAVLEPVTGGLLQVFPHDHRVPQIAAFLNDSRAFASDLFGGSGGAAGAPELARFRPGIGATFRWSAAIGPRVFVKINPATSPLRARARLTALHRAAPHSGFAPHGPGPDRIPRLRGWGSRPEGSQLLHPKGSGGGHRDQRYRPAVGPRRAAPRRLDRPDPCTAAPGSGPYGHETRASDRH